eukprot:6490708-Amphidinium_carterae.1
MVGPVAVVRSLDPMGIISIAIVSCRTLSIGSERGLVPVTAVMWVRLRPITFSRTIAPFKLRLIVALPGIEFAVILTILGLHQ